MAKIDLILLGPREVKGKDTVPIRAVVTPLDSKTPMRKEMAELINDLITKSYWLGTFNSAILTALGAMLDGKGIFEYSIGEFFLLYGRFEQKYECDGWQTRKKMRDLLGEDRKYFKRYKDRRGIICHDPLPYVVRNILAHKGRSPNTLDKENKEIKTSIMLLKQWVNL